MKILTWNIAALPSKINILGNPLYRLTGILDKIYQQAPQVICLQEVFDYKFQEKIIDELKHQGYYTHQSKKKGLISKNGLLTATQDNIRFSTEKDYSMFTGAEYLIKKGLLIFPSNVVPVSSTICSTSIVGLGGYKTIGGEPSW